MGDDLPYTIVPWDDGFSRETGAYFQVRSLYKCTLGTVAVMVLDRSDQNLTGWSFVAVSQRV